MLLDFGCGQGGDLQQIGELLGLPPHNLLGVDIFDADTAGRYTRHVTADPSDEAAYCASLSQIAQNISRWTGGTRVDFGLSVVALHHVPAPSMRSCVLRFIRAVLRPEPAATSFALLEWDNKEGELEIWFDIQGHTWGGPGGAAPATPSTLKVWPETNYSSIATFKQQFERAGLGYDRALQQLASGRSPEELADSTFDRNFEAFFSPLPGQWSAPHSRITN